MLNNTRSISRVIRDGGCVLAFALVLTAMAGCAERQVSTPVPIHPPDNGASSLAERDRVLTSLQTPAIMEYSGPAGHLKAREQLIARRPASLRVEAMSPLGIALIVAADDAEIAVFDPSDNTLMRGTANASTLARFTRIPMAPAQAVQLLLGLAPDHSILAAPPSSSRIEGGMRVLSYAGGAPNYELGFSEGQLSLVRARDTAGAVTYEVYYRDYRDIGGLKFPFAIEAHFFASATTLKFHYLNPSIDRQIADSTFVLSPGPGTRLIELGFAAPLGLPAFDS
jgi:outer membrane lipoprotein-sorting protein